MEYITSGRREHEIEDILVEEKEVLCLDRTAYELTLAIALARLTACLPVNCKVIPAPELAAVLKKGGKQ